MAKKRYVKKSWDDTNLRRSGRVFRLGDLGVTVTDYIASPLSGRSGYRRKAGAPVFFGYALIEDLMRAYRRKQGRKGRR